MVMTIRIDGLEELRGKLVGSRADGPVGRFLDRGARSIEAEAKRNAPVDTGHLRRSITTDAPSTRSRRIGTASPYGPHVEFGTRPHFPPPQALEGWARRHGFGPGGGFLVARAIARAGTREQPYLRPAATAGEGFIRSMIPVLAAEIEGAYAE